MPPGVLRDGTGNVVQLIPPIDRSPAEVHILKPKRAKTLVKTAKFPPYLPANHEESAGRLFHRHSCGIIQPQTAIPPIYRVIRKDSIKQQNFQNQGEGGRELTNHESDLRLALSVQEAAAGGSRAGQAAGVAEGLDSLLQDGIRV